MVEDKGKPDEPKKRSTVDRVCPLCRTYGKNINLYEAQNTDNEVDILVATCTHCRGLYSLERKDDATF